VSSHADRLRVQQQRADEDAATAQQRLSEAAELKAELDARERALRHGRPDGEQGLVSRFSQNSMLLHRI
jgi:hypothetical protein